MVRPFVCLSAGRAVSTTSRLVTASPTLGITRGTPQPCTGPGERALCTVRRRQRLRPLRLPRRTRPCPWQPGTRAPPRHSTPTRRWRGRSRPWFAFFCPSAVRLLSQASLGEHAGRHAHLAERRRTDSAALRPRGGHLHERFLQLGQPLRPGRPGRAARRCRDAAGSARPHGSATTLRAATARPGRAAVRAWPGSVPAPSAPGARSGRQRPRWSPLAARHCSAGRSALRRAIVLPSAGWRFTTLCWMCTISWLRNPRHRRRRPDRIHQSRSTGRCP